MTVTQSGGHSTFRGGLLAADYCPAVSASSKLPAAERNCWLGLFESSSAHKAFLMDFPRLVHTCMVTVEHRYILGKKGFDGVL